MGPSPNREFYFDHDGNEIEKPEGVKFQQMPVHDPGCVEDECPKCKKFFYSGTTPWGWGAASEQDPDTVHEFHIGQDKKYKAALKAWGGKIERITIDHLTTIDMNEWLLAKTRED